jgi:hypothetical protein
MVPFSEASKEETDKSDVEMLATVEVGSMLITFLFPKGDGERKVMPALGVIRKTGQLKAMLSRHPTISAA